MLIQGQVAPVTTTTSLPSGQQPNLRLGNMGDAVMSELHGRYYEGTYRRARFNAANQAGIVTTVGTATTYTGLCISNPVGSLINVVLEKVGAGFLVAFPASSAVGLMCGYNSTTNVTHTAAAVVRSNYFGVGSIGSALVDTSATLPTAPFVTHIFGAGLTGAITTVPEVTGVLVDLEGSVILPPGAYAAIFTSTVSGAAGLWGSFQWEEVPV